MLRNLIVCAVALAGLLLATTEANAFGGRRSCGSSCGSACYTSSCYTAQAPCYTSQQPVYYAPAPAPAPAPYYTCSQPAYSYGCGTCYTSSCGHNRCGHKRCR